MNKPFLPVILDGRSEHDIKSVAKLRSAVIDQMHSFVRCKEINKSVFKDDEYLTISADVNRGRFDFAYAGVSIRFTVVAGLSSETASAKVVCTHEYEVAGRDASDLLGEFNVDPNGRTNFQEPSGQLCFTTHTADLIIAFYIAKALENTLKVN